MNKNANKNKNKMIIIHFCSCESILLGRLTTSKLLYFGLIIDDPLFI